MLINKKTYLLLLLLFFMKHYIGYVSDCRNYRCGMRVPRVYNVRFLYDYTHYPRSVLEHILRRARARLRFFIFSSQSLKSFYFRRA